MRLARRRTEPPSGGRESGDRRGDRSPVGVASPLATLADDRHNRKEIRKIQPIRLTWYGGGGTLSLVPTTEPKEVHMEINAQGAPPVFAKLASPDDL